MMMRLGIGMPTSQSRSSDIFPEECLELRSDVFMILDFELLTERHSFEGLKVTRQVKQQQNDENQTEPAAAARWASIGIAAAAKKDQDEDNNK
jgi:hypothetical protein